MIACLLSHVGRNPLYIYFVYTFTQLLTHTGADELLLYALYLYIDHNFECISACISYFINLITCLIYSLLVCCFVFVSFFVL